MVHDPVERYMFKLFFLTKSQGVSQETDQGNQKEHQTSNGHKAAHTQSAANEW